MWGKVLGEGEMDPGMCFSETLEEQCKSHSLWCPGSALPDRFAQAWLRPVEGGRFSAQGREKGPAALRRASRGEVRPWERGRVGRFPGKGGMCTETFYHLRILLGLSPGPHPQHGCYKTSARLWNGPLGRCSHMEETRGLSAADSQDPTQTDGGSKPTQRVPQGTEEPHPRAGTAASPYS